MESRTVKQMSRKKEDYAQKYKFEQLKAPVTEMLPADNAISSQKNRLERLKNRMALGQYEGMETELQRFIEDLEKRIRQSNGASGETYLLKGKAYRLLGELQSNEAKTETFERASGAFAAGFTAVSAAQEADYAGDYGVVLVQLERDSDAVMWLEKAVEHKTEDPDVYFHLGVIEQKTNHLVKAKELFEKAVELSPNNLNFLLTLSQLLDEQGDIKEAAEYYLDALITTLSSVLRFDLALQISNRLLEIDPDNELVLMLRGEVLLQIGDLQQSVAVLDKAREIAPENPWILYSSSRAHQAIGKLDTALEQANESLELEPQNAQLWLQQASVLNTMGRVEDAEQSINRCLEIDQESLIGRIAQTELFFSTDRFEEALQSLEKAIVLSPEDPALYLYKARILAIIGQSEKALTATRMASNSVNLTPYDLLDVAAQFTALDHYEEALKAINQVLDESPEFVEALVMKGSILRELAQPDAALVVFDHILDIDSENLEAISGKASTLSMLERWDEAKELVDRALLQFPDEPKLLSAKAESLTGEARYAEAADVLGKAISIDPDVSYYYSLGMIRNLQGQYQDALDSFENAVDGFSDNPMYWSDKAFALRMLERNNEAVAAANRALELAPHDPAALLEKSFALVRLERPQEAIDAMNEAVAASPEDAEMRYFRGLMYQLLNRPEEAEISYLEALDTEPNYPLALNSLSAILQTKGKVTEAMELIERALALEPDDIQLLGAKASIYSDMGEYEAAVQTLRGIQGESASDGWVLLSARGWALENIGPGRAAEAKQAYQDALALNPEFPDNLWIRKGLANALRLLGDNEESESQYHQVVEELEQRPDTVDSETLALRGWCLYQIGEFEQAVDSYMEALSFKKEMPDTLLDFALAIMCMGNYKVAVREYEHALGVVQKYEFARQRGLLSVALDDLAEAIEEMPKLSNTPEVKAVRKLLQTAFSEATVEV